MVLSMHLEKKKTPFGHVSCYVITTVYINGSNCLILSPASGMAVFMCALLRHRWSTAINGPPCISVAFKSNNEDSPSPSPSPGPPWTRKDQLRQP